MTFLRIARHLRAVPIYLRDSLLRLAVADVYRPTWAAHIPHDCAMPLVRHDVASSEQADQIIALMRIHFPESETLGYEPLMPALTCHKKDRHVLAPAITAGASNY